MQRRMQKKMLNLLLKKIEEEIASARIEGQKIVSDARDAAAKLKVQLEEKAKDESEILVEKAKIDIQREKSAAIEEIRKNFSGIAIAAAEKIVESSLDEKKLIQN